jgi:hypothetical protein
MNSSSLMYLTNFQMPKQAGRVEGAHQLREREQRAHAVLADGEGHGAEGADRRHPHDDADDAEQDVGHFVDELKHRLSLRAERVQGKAEQDREQQHLQDLALGESVHDGVGNDVQQEIGGGLHLARRRVLRDGLGIESGRVDVHSSARLQDVDHHQPHDQGERAHRLEIEQGIAAGLADRFHVFHAGDADHHGAEDDRRDDHLDQLDEAVAERLHGRAGLGEEIAEQDADHDGHDHLEVEALVERLLHLFSSKRGFSRWAAPGPGTAPPGAGSWGG